MSEIVPFRVEIADSEIADLRRRLADTRWPDKEPADDWSQGIPLAYTRELAEYWAGDYDMNRVADELNRFEQFITAIDGVDIHFLHVRSPEPNATPCVMIHGWPGSVVEFSEVIGPLVDPVAHGGDAADALHLVIPSLPGYGWSGKPTELGWDLRKIGEVFQELMTVLGYDRFLVQGGDWGALIALAMGAKRTDAVLGLHVNVMVADPEKLMALGELTEDELETLQAVKQFHEVESAYAHQQGTRPQTLGYALTDSPVGQMAWVVEKFKVFADCDGHPENAMSRDQMLDIVMSFWLNRSAASSARLYWEAYRTLWDAFFEVESPVAYSRFHEFNRASERWARTRLPDLRYYHHVAERGGHWAAVEAPEVFVREVRAGYRAIREG